MFEAVCESNTYQDQNHSEPARAARGAVLVRREATRGKPTPSQQLEPDLEMALRFLKKLAPGESVAFQTFDDRPEKRTDLAQVRVGTPKQCWPDLARLNDLGAGVSVTVNRVANGRKAENVTGVRALFVDLDEAGLDALKAVALKPHIIVESSPGRYHAYYLLAEDFPLNEWLPHETALARLCRGDISATKINTCLRVPGFFHQKGEPVRVSLLKINEHPAYDLSEVEVALGAEAEALRAAASERAERAGLAPGRRLEPEAITPRMRDYAASALVREVEALRASQEGERNDRLNRAAFSLGTLVGAGVLEDAQVEDALTDAARDAGLARGEIEATLRSGLNAGMLAPRDLSHLLGSTAPNETPPDMLGDLKKSKAFRKVWNRAAPHGKTANKDDYALACETLRRRPAATDQDLCDILHAFKKEAPDTPEYRGDVPADQEGWNAYAQRTIDMARRDVAERERADGERLDRLGEYLRGFVYLTDGERFVCLKTGASYSTKSFAMLVERECPGAMDAPVGPLFARLQNKVLLHDTYLPGQPRIVEAEDKNGARSELLNTYNAPELPEPKRDSELERLFLEHVDMISGRSEVFVEYLLNFLATLVQKPGQRINSAPVLISPATGTGKTFLMDLMQRVLGKSNVGVITTSGLDSGFQDALMHSQLMCVEEIKVHEKTLSLMDTLKPYITNERISVNRKGLPMVTVDNVANWMFFSNHEDALRPDPQERRYCVAINREPARSQDYFRRLYGGLLTDEGVAAVLHLLKNRDLSAFDHHAPAPKTEARQDMIESAYSAIERALADAIESRTLGASDRLDLQYDLCTAEDLSTFFVTTHRVMEGISSTIPSPQQVARAFKKVGAVNLGQKRIHDGSKPRVWAIRNVDKWQRATESEIADHFEQREAARRQTKEGPKPATALDGSRLN